MFKPNQFIYFHGKGQETFIPEKGSLKSVIKNEKGKIETFKIDQEGMKKLLEHAKKNIFMISRYFYKDVKGKPWTEKTNKLLLQNVLNIDTKNLNHSDETNAIKILQGILEVKQDGKMGEKTLESLFKLAVVDKLSADKDFMSKLKNADIYKIQECRNPQLSQNQKNEFFIEKILGMNLKEYKKSKDYKAEMRKSIKVIQILLSSKIKDPKKRPKADGLVGNKTLDALEEYMEEQYKG